MSNYTDHTLTDAIEGLRQKMKMEHDPAWQAGVHAFVQEMMLAAAQTAIERAERARTRFYGALVPLLPEPAPEPPAALQSGEAPCAALNGGIYGHYDDEDLYENPRFMRGSA